MKLVLDTNVYVLCDAGNTSALATIEKASRFLIPVIVYGELYYGFRHGSNFQKNLARLEKFIDEFSIDIIEVDPDVARKFGDIYASLRKKGRPIPTNDIWIAACTMSVGGVLLTCDRHFAEVEQIQVELVERIGAVS